MKNQKKEFANKWQILCAVMSGGFMASVDGSVVNLILPTLVEFFDSGFSIIQWVVVSYLLTVATLILPMGRLGDLIGRKKVYLTGFIIFTAGSLLCGFAGSISLIIVFRVIQGLGATMILALGFAVATEAFPANERGKAMGILASVVSLGVIVGPVIGGFLVDYASWRWIFFINLPIGAFGIYLILRYVPDKKSDKSENFDFAGAFLFFICMLGLLAGLTFGEKNGFKDSSTLILLGVSFVSGLIFIITELKVKSPMLDLRIFSDFFFSVNLFVTFVFYFAISGVFVLAPFYLQNILGYMPNQMGMLFGIMSFLMFFISPLSGVLSDRLGTSFVINISLIIMTLIYFLISLLIQADTGNLYCMIAMIILGAGMGFFMSPNHSAIMGAISPKHLGIVSGLLILARTLGQTTGVSVLGLIWISKVKVYNGAEFANGILSSSEAARIKGLKDIFLYASLLMGISFSLILMSVYKQRFIKSAESFNPASN